MSGRLFVISGPSGAGKGTLVSRLMSCRDGLWLSVSATTRSPRPGEVEGQSYFFLDNDRFDQLVAEGGFLEWANVFTNRYGTLKSVVESKIESGTSVVLEIDPQGARQVKQNYPDAFLIFVKPPSFEVLEQRLRGRATESEEQVQIRLQTARTEMQQEGHYDVTIVNDDLETAVQQLLEVVDSQIAR